MAVQACSASVSGIVARLGPSWERLIGNIVNRVHVMCFDHRIPSSIELCEGRTAALLPLSIVVSVQDALVPLLESSAVLIRYERTDHGLSRWDSFR